MRKFLHLLLFVGLVTAGLNLSSTTAQAADTGNAAPQRGKIVSDEPGKNAPNILDGSVYSIAKVGNTIVVGGEFTQAQNYNTQATLTRRNLLAYDATTGKISTAFAPDPVGPVFKVLPAADGTSVYVAGNFESAAGTSTPGRVFKMDVNNGALDTAFQAPIISGLIRDLELTGSHLWIAGKFTHINGIEQTALGTINALTGKRDPFMANVFAGLHRTTHPEDLTNVIQISVNKQNTRLMAVGNFTTVDGLPRHQIVQLDITGAAPVVSNWSTTMYNVACSQNFETYMTDVEYSPNGQFFVVSTTGAYGGLTGSMAGTTGCDVVARFESSSNTASTATWTAYPGGDTTWTVEVTDNVVYAGGHQRWQNNPGAGDRAGQGAVSREGIAALNTQNGMPYSWNPTRARGVGVQDLLATSEGLYVGSDTDLIGHTVGNTYHARIAVLPLATGTTLPQLQANNLPVDVYRVASGASQLTKRNFTGTTVGTSTNVASGPGWGTSTGAFMVNGVLYKTNTDGSLSRMTFDGTNYGTASAVNTSDALVLQSDWHNDAKVLTSIFYNDGFIYYTLSGQNALYRRGFEVESGVVGQQRFSTTSTSVNYSQVRGAFVAGGKMVYATSNGQSNLWSIAWNQAAHNVTGTTTQLSLVGTGWASRALFPYQAVPGPFNESPLAAATISCDQLVCTNDGTGSTDPEAGALSYDWDFGDGTPHGTTATATHTYADGGNRPVTLTVTDNKGATSSVTKTASPTAQPDNISFVGISNTNGNRSSHTVSVPAGTQWGDTLLLYFSSNSTVPVYTGPAGWQQVISESGSSFVGRLYTKTANAADLGSSATVLSKNTDGTNYLAKSDTTMVAYRGVGAPEVKASGVTTQDSPGTVHQTPTVSSPDGTSWLVSYWTDKSSLTTAWTGPGTETQRALGVGTGSSHMSSLLMDSDGRVNSGAQGGLNATANSSAQGLTMSVLLNGGTPPSNVAPVAHASLVGCTDLTCSFDGGSSTDADGDVLTYDWNWGDGTTHGTTATASHTFTSAGAKTVTLTVTDPDGASGVDSVVANPVEPPPNLAPTAHITDAACVDLGCSFTGSTSSDPDSDTLTYSWDFGDATAASTTANPTHTYATAGAKTVILTVDDGHGHTDTDTTVVNPTPPNLAPDANITNVTCTDFDCSFTGSTSSDPDGDALTYSWDFGDATAASTTADPTHTYATAGAKTVTLTVDDGHGHTNSETATATPVDPNAEPVSNIAFVGSASNVGNSTIRTVTLPSGITTGDTMVLFLGAASIAPTYTGPTGWTLLDSKDGTTSMAVRAWTKTATSTDTGVNVKVSVTSSTAAKADLTVAVYRGTHGTTPIASIASKIDNTAGAAHTSPVVTATAETNWLVTYWGDRSNTSTAWTAPAGQSVRWPGLASDTGPAHVIALLTDSNGRVTSGPQGGLTATANGDSSRGASVSILLKSSP